MGPRALIAARRVPRALYAAGVLTALLAALLGAWFYSGWHEVRQSQHDLSLAPRAAADARASELARVLHAEFEALIAREASRPYFHYQNLMHDPNASAGLNVSPSPLARGPGDDLVLGYFQLDAKGRASTPTINDEVPALSEPQRLTANRAFRDQVTHELSQLRPAMAKATPLVARAEPTAPPQASPPRPQPEAASPVPPKRAQAIQVDPNVYVQNLNSNRVYSQQQALNANAPALRPQAPPAAAAPVPARAAAPVTITISSLEWRTLPFAGAPALIAVRQVQTPDGAFAQGFVVNRSTLTTWLAARAGDMVAELRQGDSRGAEVASGWRLTVEPDPRTVARAADEARAAARTFLMRFIGVGLLAVLAAAFVVLLVMRAETLANERSRFAAAAAHELRTPLAGLQLYGDLLADGLGDPAKMRDYGRRMSEEASRLGRVVSNVLGFSELERGRLSVDAQAGPLGEALRELAERAQPTLHRAGATLELDVALDLRARFDRDALARIVGNLIDNAEKYSREAEDRTIRLSTLDRGDVVEVRVEDHGPGITDRTKLFRLFSRGASGSDGPAGLGLGLALSMSLARAMGGELAYRTRDGGGATFVLRLPAA
jgi:signal transduction histidine kinase